MVQNVNTSNTEDIYKLIQYNKTEAQQFYSAQPDIRCDICQSCVTLRDDGIGQNEKYICTRKICPGQRSHTIFNIFDTLSDKYSTEPKFCKTCATFVISPFVILDNSIRLNCQNYGRFCDSAWSTYSHNYKMKSKYIQGYQEVRTPTCNICFALTIPNISSNCDTVEWICERRPACSATNNNKYDDETHSQDDRIKMASQNMRMSYQYNSRSLAKADDIENERKWKKPSMI